MKSEVYNTWKSHQALVENWDYGEPCDDWRDKDGNLCIRYSSGKWFHYRNSGGSVEFW